MGNWRAVLHSLSASFVLLLWYAFCELPTGVAKELPQPHSIQETEAIHVWYGENQQFGIPGLAQPFVNIPGRVSTPDQVASLSFSLNNGPQHSLNVGPDSRRLAAAGDFNIEIHGDELRPGKNHLSITRVLKNNYREVQDANISYQQQAWPLPYRVEWSEVDNLQDAVQVVDGHWLLTESGIRTVPQEIGYDRSLALGDSSWSSYEILLPFTVNGIDASGYETPESVSPGLGILMHWNGHTDNPVDCGQPHCGWFPAGAIHWYSFPENKPGGFNINTRPISDLSVAFPYELKTGTGYLLRCRVETLAFTTHYYLKVWQQGEEEPGPWSLQKSADRKNPNSGGLLLVAHHVDLTFGTIEIRAVTPEKSDSFSGYFILLPQILTVAAGFIFLCIWVIKKKRGQKGRGIVVAFSLAAIILCIYLEPLLPELLKQYPFNEKMNAALYIGYDFSFTFLMFLVWISILFSLFPKRQREVDG